MGKTNCWWARIAVLYPPWEIVPSGYLPFCPHVIIIAEIHREQTTYIGIDLLRAVIFVPVLALPALHTAPDLGANTNTVSGLDALDILADAHCTSHDLVADNEGERRGVAPALLEGVHVGTAYATVCDSDFHIICLKRLRFEGLHLEVGKIFWVCGATCQ